MEMKNSIHKLALGYTVRYNKMVSDGETEHDTYPSTATPYDPEQIIVPREFGNVIIHPYRAVSEVVSEVVSDTYKSEFTNTAYTNHQCRGSINTICNNNLQMNYEKEDHREMSYAYYLASQNGIALLSDSRTSTFLTEGQVVENDNTKKLFRGNNYLVASYGFNKIYKLDRWIPLAQTIEDICSKATVRKFLEMMQYKLRESFAADKTIIYNFWLTYIDPDNDPILEEWQIQPNGMTLTGREIGISSRFLKNYFITPGKPDPNWSIEELVDVGRKVVSSAIRFNDIFLSYNPAGGPIQVETLEINQA